VRFWDSSALVPLLSDEPTTDDMYALFRADPAIAVAFITPVEVTSAITRRAGVNRDLLARAERRYDVLDAIWQIVDEYELALADARRLAIKHELRSGDAIQLACARLASGGNPSEIPFVTTDLELATAARAEGFPTLP
jgi:predicted nucleic acid-binding protein